MFANRHFSWKMDFFCFFYCLLMIVSFDTIKCGRQIYFFNKRLLLKQRHVKYNYLFFLKNLLLLKKHFETVMSMWPKIFLTLSFYSTFSEYSCNKAQWSKDTCRVQSGRNGHRGTGCKAQEMFFFMVESTQFCSFEGKL